jgi:hypothetical protein
MSDEFPFLDPAYNGILAAAAIAELSFSERRRLYKHPDVFNRANMLNWKEAFQVAKHNPLYFPVVMLGGKSFAFFERKVRETSLESLLRAYGWAAGRSTQNCAIVNKILAACPPLAPSCVWKHHTTDMAANLWMLRLEPTLPDDLLEGTATLVGYLRAAWPPDARKPFVNPWERFLP